MNRIELANSLIEQGTKIILQEGAQKEAYKKKKLEEKIENFEKNKQRPMYQEYSHDGLSKVYYANPYKAVRDGKLSEKDAHKHSLEMSKIAHKASDITRKEADRRNVIAKKNGKYYDEDFDYDYLTAMDATNRHLRRHKSQNESISELLQESAELLNEDAELFAVISIFLAYIGGIIAIPLIARNVAEKKTAKSSVVVSLEDWNDMVRFITDDVHSEVVKIFNSGKNKNYLDTKSITIYDKFHKMDLSHPNDKKFKNKSFYAYFDLFSINLVKLAKETGQYDKVITTNDRLEEYIKKESENIAKIIDKCREICYKNKFIKDNFNIQLEYNEGKTVVFCTLRPNNSFILNTSKYVKVK